jgi:hypothetical protein
MMSTMRLFTALALLALGSSSAFAQQRPVGPAVPPTPTMMEPAPLPASGKVDVELLVVHATHNGQVDAKLEGLVENLKFTRYTGFSVLETYDARVAPGQDASFTIVGGRKVQITLIDRDSRNAKVRVLMFNQTGKVMDTTVSIHRNRAFIIAGPDHDGGKLVLPVTVSY